MSTITCNEKMKDNAKCKNFRLEPPFGDLWVTYTVYLWLAGKRVVDFLLVLIKFCSLALMAAALLSEICRNQRFLMGWVILSANFRGKGLSTNEFWRQKTRVPGLSRGVVCVILRLAVLIPYRRVTHGQTHRQTRDDGYYPRIACGACVKIL